MRNRLVVLTTVLAIFLVEGSTMGPAQELINQKALSLEMAVAIAQGALDQCRADGYHASVAVVDGSGLLKVFLRDDGNSPHTVNLSQRKAYTAMTFRRTSSEMAKVFAADAAHPTVEGTVPIGGGVPIKAGTTVIGGIGVSGSPTPQKDETCASAGVAKMADKLK